MYKTPFCKFGQVSRKLIALKQPSINKFPTKVYTYGSFIGMVFGYSLICIVLFLFVYSRNLLMNIINYNDKIKI